MAETHKFRGAFNGFNRQDVVTYIEYLNHKHAGIVNQLKSENQALKDELAAAKNACAADSEKDALIAQLRIQLEEAGCPAPDGDFENAELEAYRRAERAERAAKERADQIYFKATAALAEAATQVDDAAKLFDTVADQINAQVAQIHAAVNSGKTALQDAAATMYTIAPETEE